ncbi:MAG: UxaA family hydrolase, partial [Dehalococcoidales bacterium]|nr:UxaA family hydrolase [Dehalococcoidales bacterium]
MNFQGYPRQNGTVGIRNHVLIFPTVICSSEVARMISQAVPGTVHVAHPHGCGHLGVEKEHIIRTMSGFCSNPNVAAVLLVGNGCELISTEVLAEELKKSHQRFEIVNVQDEGGTTGAVEKGKSLAERLKHEAQKARRVSCSMSDLIVGVKCGGSDTLSGLTANPAVGYTADLVVSHGGTVLMSEVPEMLGAEHVLAGRVRNRETAERILQITSAMEKKILEMGVDIRGTEPSPGNIEGGLSTLEEKSLGAILKGGSTAVQQVVQYAERPSEKGLVIMDGPALDAVVNTGMVAAGAQIIVFTTGRGTPLG